MGTREHIKELLDILKIDDKSQNKLIEEADKNYSWGDAIKDVYKSETEELKQEIEKLKALHREIYEVWAGSAGIGKPVTPSNLYQLGLIKEMKDIASKGMK